jgi:uncharacterized protein YdeI (YjbR/CyaY-like superfamily)
MENPAYNKKYNLRLPQELYDKVEELGHTYDRSANEQMVYMLRTWQKPATIEERLARIEEYIHQAESKKAVGQ